MRSSSVRKPVLNLTPNVGKSPTSRTEVGSSGPSEKHRARVAPDRSCGRRRSAGAPRLDRPANRHVALFARALARERIDAKRAQPARAGIEAHDPGSAAAHGASRVDPLRAPQPDKRLVTVHLTEEGRALKPKLLPIARLNHNTALAGFKKAEIEMLFECLASDSQERRQASRAVLNFDGDKASGQNGSLTRQS